MRHSFLPHPLRTRTCSRRSLSRGSSARRRSTPPPPPSPPLPASSPPPSRRTTRCASPPCRSSASRRTRPRTRRPSARRRRTASTRRPSRSRPSSSSSPPTTRHPDRPFRFREGTGAGPSFPLLLRPRSSIHAIQRINTHLQSIFSSSFSFSLLVVSPLSFSFCRSTFPFTQSSSSRPPSPASVLGSSRPRDRLENARALEPFVPRVDPRNRLLLARGSVIRATILDGSRKPVSHGHVSNTSCTKNPPGP